MAKAVAAALMACIPQAARRAARAPQVVHMAGVEAGDLLMLALLQPELAAQVAAAQFVLFGPVQPVRSPQQARVIYEPLY
jgi:hypothetical protein